MLRRIDGNGSIILCFSQLFGKSVMYVRGEMTAMNERKLSLVATKAGATCCCVM